VKLRKEILAEIKRRVKESEPDAEVFLYGSYARGDANKDSDVDLLILVKKNNLGFKEKLNITGSLYRLGFENGLTISPLVQSKKTWEEHFYFTPLFDNIRKEGIEI
jgi:predicted nucleotidyltransferase